MFRRSGRLVAGVNDFVDPNYIRNKRPPIPNAAWSRALLARKSTTELQQLWFVLLKERSMLRSMKEHYIEHTEELGAMPAPSRLNMVEEGMANLKAVVRDRDNKATDRAVALFQERLKKGIYRYPPGPQLPPGAGDPTSKVQLTLSQHVDAEVLRELLGRYDVFETHKGIVSLTVEISPEALQRKLDAEAEFDAWWQAKADYENYHRFDSVLAGEVPAPAPGAESADSAADERQQTAPSAARKSVYDTAAIAVELAPGEFVEEDIMAADMPVPPTKVEPPATDMMQRLQNSSKTWSERRQFQYPAYPHLSTADERPAPPGARPQHPDEIEGPWVATVVYTQPDGLAYVLGLEMKRVHGADVLKVEDVTVATPAADRCPIFQEALREEAADQKLQEEWPNMPQWNRNYSKYLMKPLDEIIAHNYNNVGDYVDREALLTGKSVWEPPIEIDPSCGGQVNVPPHAKRPDVFLRKAEYAKYGDN